MRSRVQSIADSGRAGRGCQRAASLACVAALVLLSGGPSQARNRSVRDPRVAAGLADPEAEVLAPAAGPAADQVLRERSRPLLASPAASLRAAVQAIAAGDRTHAIWLLDEVMRRHPIVGDHAALLQLGLIAENGDPERVAANARRALAEFPESPMRAELHVALGGALEDLGDLDGAFAAWRAALDRSHDDALRSAVLVQIGAAQERIGLDEEAAATYKLLWYAHPDSAEARIAAHRLELLEEFLGKPVRESSDWRRRGDRLFRKRDNESALDAYERALELGLSRAETERTRRQRAHTLFRQRRYPEAVAAFGELRQVDDIPIWTARSRARAGEVPEAITDFERLGKSSRGALSIRARFLAALLLDGRGLDERAEAHYRAVARSRTSAGMGDAAGWRLGWSAYRQGRHEEALRYFDGSILYNRGDAIEQLRPRYWRARSLAHMGDARAEAEFRAIATEFPLSYYGWRARSRAGAEGPAAIRATVPVGRNQLAPRELARPRILLEAGLVEPVRRELAELSRRARGLEERLELAELATDAGDFHTAQSLAVNGYNETLARGPVPRLEELWWYAWPSAYAELVESATSGPDSVPPELVYSIMREESGYRAAVVSPVGARGLLQIMTTTGARLAQTTGLTSFHANDLFEPRTNIGLGSHYLSELSQRFSGRLSASIASYNAGPEAVSEWEFSSLDDDEWVEAIPYDQTRSYVKRVLRSLHAYRVLY